MRKIKLIRLEDDFVTDDFCQKLAEDCELQLPIFGNIVDLSPNIYCEDTRDQLIEDDMLSPLEVAFMRGWDQAE